LIDPRSKALAWRVYLIRKITNPDKDWKKPNKEFTKGFESYPPSEKETEAKKKEREEHKPNDEQPCRSSPKIRAQFPA
jgi:hypothetical protein